MDELDGDSLSHAKWEREYHGVRISKRQMMVPYTQLRQFLGTVPDWGERPQGKDATREPKRRHEQGRGRDRNE